MLPALSHGFCVTQRRSASSLTARTGNFFPGSKTTDTKCKKKKAEMQKSSILRAGCGTSPHPPHALGTLQSRITDFSWEMDRESSPAFLPFPGKPQSFPSPLLSRRVLGAQRVPFPQVPADQGFIVPISCLWFYSHNLIFGAAGETL